MYVVMLISLHLDSFGSPLAQKVKNEPAMQQTQVQSLGWKDSLEKGMATHSSSLPWRLPQIETLLYAFSKPNTD